MATYVRARDPGELRKRVDAHGRHADVAVRAGLHPSRLSQLLAGLSPSIPLVQAAKLENVLGAKPGSLFVLDDAELIGPYLPPDVRRPRKRAS